MDSNSFTEATGRVLRILPKLYAGTIRMQYAQEHGMLSEANMMAFENYRHAEALALCYRAIPTYTGLPYAKKEVQRIMSEEVPFEIGYTDEGWFCVRFPRMLPKKEKGGVEYIRGQLYPALERFFKNEFPVQVTCSKPAGSVAAEPTRTKPPMSLFVASTVMSTVTSPAPPTV